MKKKGKMTRLQLHIKYMEKEIARSKKNVSTYYFRKQIEVTNRMLNK
jgi:hypothetical protein